MNLIGSEVSTVALDGGLDLLRSTVIEVAGSELRPVRLHDLHGHVTRGVIHDVADRTGPVAIGNDLAIRLLRLRGHQFPRTEKFIFQVLCCLPLLFCVCDMKGHRHKKSEPSSVEIIFSYDVSVCAVLGERAAPAGDLDRQSPPSDSKTVRPQNR